ncbi:LytR/AlgR family response regulator transcription factor [Paraclostridium bifermentans]|uniref:LytR/AlgR family response regulator transcription factor n=1 Tax=Paraclostridium bifermentans TaxID=1490 RepID=UPI00359C11F4
MEKILPSKYFVRCHRSYIVNVKHIKTITKNNVFLENGVKVPISRGKYKEINDTFIDYISE